MSRSVVVSVFGLAVALLLTGLFSLVATAAPNQGNGSNPQFVGGYAIIGLSGKPVAEYRGGIAGYPATQPAAGHKLDLASAPVVSYRAYLGIQHANYRAWLASNAPQVQILREYDLVLNGFAVQLNGASPNALGRGPAAATVTPDWLYKPTMDVSIPLIHAPAVWSALGPSPDNPDLPDLGSVKVGVIDTGILDTHPFIADCREPDSIPHQVFFSGAGTSAFGPDIFFDHGTHVAGTIGGCPIPAGTTLTLPNGEMELVGGDLVGVAPGVSLADYNVFPGYGAGFIAFGGSAFSHDIIAAVEASVADGMDIINLSLSGNVQGPYDTLAVAIDAAAHANTLPVVAAGNEGPGILTVGSPGNAAGALAAGASTNPHYPGIAVHLDDAAFGSDQGSVLGAVTGEFVNFDPAITAETANVTPANGCTISQDLTDKIAVIVRGACTFGTKIQNAQDHGAVGVIMVNNVAGDPIPMGSDDVHFPTIPAAMISQADGPTLLNHDGAQITVDGTSVTEILTPNADILAGFSSKGPTPYDFLVKPDVTAPGVNVLSSIFEINATTGEYEPEFAFFDGTSMATPHTAGSAALLKALHADWGPEEIKSALTNNADRTVTGTSNLGPIARGGGRINVERAAEATVFLDPVSVSFGAWTGGKTATASVSVAFTNGGAADVTCDLSIVTGSAATAPVSVAPDSLSIGTGETESATVSLNGGTTLGSGFYWGDLVAECDGTTYLAPWWTAVQRGNGALNGNQNSPANVVAGFDPAFYGNPAFLVAGRWTG